MLLRRIIEHVKAQNWTAVALDFVIVVVGVFIGIQVANWNEAQAESRRAFQSLEELRAEYESIAVITDELVGFYEGVIGDLQIVVSTVHEGGIDDEAEAALIRALSYGDVFGDPPPPSGTFRDLQSAGELRLITDKVLRLRLIEYDQSLETINLSNAAITDMMTPFVAAFRRHSRLSTSYQLPKGDDFSFIEAELPAVVDADYAALLSDPEFRVASEQYLRLQVGRYFNAKVAQSKVQQIQAMIGRNLAEAR
ncbi:hypothetical protein PUV54_03165 [Hyphococcus flavus]|uniref:Uncharacterized protein n=1 Tax=Hyphococcus flavus TaxID=1866326 RepID=A0AAE9ZCW3_9PROT|nr:hypothetical protein [Hyphococcus flavus]WDI32191.1 hypothetical protein PUV54_03165 [Hyphococcus flavus]